MSIWNIILVDTSEEYVNIFTDLSFPDSLANNDKNCIIHVNIQRVQLNLHLMYMTTFSSVKNFISLNKKISYVLRIIRKKYAQFLHFAKPDVVKF